MPPVGTVSFGAIDASGAVLDPDAGEAAEPVSKVGTELFRSVKNPTPGTQENGRPQRVAPLRPASHSSLS